ncbi:hypothetical protein M569_08773 [Genlisea aurea]|uniref:Uncharacterized protein n=1 Tax=Genlisea aurea TaxID=192259 RepID=S8CGE0_9LAMI|nr:hypothetical protein M569_08773 [Genlisea aurea]
MHTNFSNFAVRVVVVILYKSFLTARGNEFEDFKLFLPARDAAQRKLLMRPGTY